MTDKNIKKLVEKMNMIVSMPLLVIIIIVISSLSAICVFIYSFSVGFLTGTAGLSMFTMIIALIIEFAFILKVIDYELMRKTITNNKTQLKNNIYLLHPTGEEVTDQELNDQFIQSNIVLLSLYLTIFKWATIVPNLILFIVMVGNIFKYVLLR